jgi:hypothetical protein
MAELKIVQSGHCEQCDREISSRELYALDGLCYECWKKVVAKERANAAG